MAARLIADWLNSTPPRNVWVGATVESDAQRKRIEHLLRIPAALHWVSVEPMLGPLHSWLDEIGWLVVGGMSGPDAKPLHPDWVRSLRDQCTAAGVPFWFKQYGEWAPAASVESQGTAWNGWWELHHEDGGAPRWCQKHGSLYMNCTSECEPLYRVGKKHAGNLLDGRRWTEIPQVFLVRTLTGDQYEQRIAGYEEENEWSTGSAP